MKQGNWKECIWRWDDDLYLPCNFIHILFLFNVFLFKWYKNDTGLSNIFSYAGFFNGEFI